MSKSSWWKNNSLTILSIAGGDKGVHTFPMKKHNNMTAISYHSTGFYGISTIVGYLMPNPFYTYILNTIKYI